MKKIKICSVMCCLFMSSGVMAITLDEAIHEALLNSDLIKASVKNYESTTLSADSVNRSILPKLSLDGTYKKQSEVSEVSVGPNKIKLTDTYFYSVGPTINFTLFDFGKSSNQFHSLENKSKALDEQVTLTKNQIKLNTRLAFTQAVYALENLAINRQLLELSAVQNKDILNRYHAGSSNKLDALSSDTEISNYQLRLDQAISDFNSALIDLNYLTHNKLVQNSISTTLDELTNSLKPAEAWQPSNHPSVKSQTFIKTSNEYLKNADSAKTYPTINLQLRSSIDYPNGNSFKNFNQNYALISFNWSLFEFGATTSEIKAKVATIAANEYLIKDLKHSLAREYEKSSQKILNLQDQIKKAQNIVLKDEELSKLNFNSYKYGKLNFSDVQNSNLRLLEAKNKLAQLKTQILIQSFNILYITERE